MFASFLETMELAALDMIVVIDGAAYAPIEPLYYALYDAIIAELCRAVFISGLTALLLLLAIVGLSALVGFLRRRKTIN